MVEIHAAIDRFKAGKLLERRAQRFRGSFISRRLTRGDFLLDESLARLSKSLLLFEAINRSDEFRTMQSRPRESAAAQRHKH